MEQIFSVFGIDWKLLAINVANFAVVLFVLWRFLYGPILQMLEERRQKIAQGVADAEAARAQLEEVEASRTGLLAKAGQEADDLLARARDAASKTQAELVAESETNARRIIESAQMQAQELKAKALQESKEEVARLIVLGMEKAFKQH